MKTLLTDQEQRVGRLEKGFAAVSSSNLRIESLGCEIQREYQRLSSVSRRNEDMLPGLFSEVKQESNLLNSLCNIGWLSWTINYRESRSLD